jgi:hypothetical protein
MKFTILITSILFFGLYNLNKKPNDFDSELSHIVHKFKEEIMDEDECEKQKQEAGDLVEDIEDALKMEDSYTSKEMSELKDLKKEAKALEGFIAAVGNCGNYIPNLDDFNLANRRVGASVVSVSKNEYCVDVISVTIDDYVAYLGENNSLKNYTVTYKWKALNAINTGEGTMGLSKKSVRHIYDNREKPSQKKVTVFGITCKEF